MRFIRTLRIKIYLGQTAKDLATKVLKGEHFRVGPLVGKAVVVTPWIVIQRRCC